MTKTFDVILKSGTIVNQDGEGAGGEGSGGEGFGAGGLTGGSAEAFACGAPALRGDEEVAASGMEIFRDESLGVSHKA